MKNILLFALLFAAGHQLYAQMHISTNYRQDYTWDETNAKWVLASEDPQSATLFDFNKDFTMFKHTTATISSTYYIKSNTHDAEKNIWEYDVVSDVGNRYHIILDPSNNNIRFVGKDANGVTFLVRHTIKRLWYDSE